MFHQDQTRGVVVNYNIDKVYDAVLKGVEGLSGFTVKNNNRITHSITINVGMSLFSWGEQMNVSMIEISDNKTEIQFNSGSKLGTEFAANSKNRKNIDAVMNAMSKYLQ